MRREHARETTFSGTHAQMKEILRKLLTEENLIWNPEISEVLSEDRIQDSEVKGACSEDCATEALSKNFHYRDEK